MADLRNRIRDAHSEVVNRLWTVLTVKNADQTPDLWRRFAEAVEEFYVTVYEIPEDL